MPQARLLCGCGTFWQINCYDLVKNQRIPFPAVCFWLFVFDDASVQGRHGEEIYSHAGTVADIFLFFPDGSPLRICLLHVLVVVGNLRARVLGTAIVLLDRFGLLIFDTCSSRRLK